MHSLNQRIAGDYKLLIITGIDKCRIITNTQRDPALTGKANKVAGDQLEFAGLMMLLIRQSLVLSY